jgi:hypothetical protein
MQVLHKGLTAQCGILNLSNRCLHVFIFKLSMIFFSRLDDGTSRAIIHALYVLSGYCGRSRKVNHLCNAIPCRFAHCCWLFKGNGCGVFVGWFYI